MKITRLLAITGALLTMVFSQGLQPTDANAYEFFTGGACSKLKWASDPLFELSTISFPGQLSRSAIHDPGNTIENIGGHWLDFGWTTFNGNAAFKNGDNEVYAASFAQWDMENFAGWARVRKNYVTCKITEADIVLDSDDLWYRGVPEDYGFNYWESPYWLTINGQSRKSMRQVALHELLHAAGLKHEDNTWAIMNYGDYPWTNRQPEHQMAPLPDDRRGLRVLYPNNVTENDVAIVNHYVNYDSVSSNGVPRQRRLCRGSGGNEFSDSMFDSYCGKPVKFFVCPGDRIYTRFSIANYSTSSTTVQQRLYFSSDTNLQTFIDTKSDTVWSKSLGAGRHHREGHSFEVPADLFTGNVYNLIMHLESDLPNEYEGNNWIPLRGQIVTAANCNPAFHND